MNVGAAPGLPLGIIDFYPTALFRHPTHQVFLLVLPLAADTGAYGHASYSFLPSSVQLGSTFAWASVAMAASAAALAASAA
jgi:hypothetical protein